MGLGRAGLLGLSAFSGAEQAQQQAAKDQVDALNPKYDIKAKPAKQQAIDALPKDEQSYAQLGLVGECQKRHDILLA